MIIKNPYTIKYQEAIKTGDEEKILVIEAKWHAFNKEQLDKVYLGIPVVKIKVEELEEKVDKPVSIRKEYKEACNVYREIDGLLKRIRFVKKQYREKL